MSLHLDTLKEQLEGYIKQRDLVHINFQQLAGAIHVLENLIKGYESGATTLDKIENIVEAIQGGVNEQTNSENA